MTVVRKKTLSKEIVSKSSLWQLFPPFQHKANDDFSFSFFHPFFFPVMLCSSFDDNHHHHPKSCSSIYSYHSTWSSRLVDWIIHSCIIICNSLCLPWSTTTTTKTDVHGLPAFLTKVSLVFLSVCTFSFFPFAVHLILTWLIVRQTDNWFLVLYCHFLSLDLINNRAHWILRGEKEDKVKSLFGFVQILLQVMLCGSLDPFNWMPWGMHITLIVCFSFTV